MEGTGSGPLNVGVIGLGSMGVNHARVLAEIPSVNLVAVCDVDQRRLEAAVRGRTVRGYHGYREMLEAEELDAVTVAVPTRLHFELASAALERRIPVLVEKPLAPSATEARGLVEMAREWDAFLTVGHIERFNPAVQELSRQVQEGRLGRVFCIHARRVGPFPDRIRDVGVVRDLATHDIDVMRMILGTEVASLFALTEQRIHTDYEDLLAAVLRFQDGVVGVLDVNWLTPTKIRELSVLGEKGMFVVDYLTQDLHFFENEAAGHTPIKSPLSLAAVSEGTMTRMKVAKQEPLRVEMQAFVQAVAGCVPPPVSPDDGVAAVQVAELIIESARCGRAVAK